jgi:type VI secretion system Hcp family effector
MEGDVSVHYYLKMDPEVKSDCDDKKHPGEIELLGFEFRQTQKSQDGKPIGKVKMDDLVVRMQTSQASPLLFQHCHKGKSFKGAVLTCNKASGEGEQDWYLKWTLEDVSLSEFRHMASALDAHLAPIGGMQTSAIIPLEEVHLSYGKLKMEYRPLKGGSFGAAETGTGDRSHK